MNRGLWSRLTFLLYLTKEHNEEHKDSEAVFFFDKDSVNLKISNKNGKCTMFQTKDLSDLTEESVYEIYKAIKETDTTDDQ